MSRKIELDDEKIYKLRKKGMGHVAIARLFNVSHTTIARKCKEIFREKGEEEPRTIKKSKFTTKNRLEISDDEIYELRTKGLTYEEIAEQLFENKGIKVSYMTIRRRCKKIFEERGEPEPEIARKTHNKTRNREEISDEEIYELRKQNFSSEVIAKYFTKNGRPVGRDTIRTRSKKIFEDKGETEPIIISSGKSKEETLDELEQMLKEMMRKKEESEELVKKYEKLESVAENEKGEEK